MSAVVAKEGLVTEVFGPINVWDTLNLTPFAAAHLRHGVLLKMNPILVRIGNVC